MKALSLTQSPLCDLLLPPGTTRMTECPRRTAEMMAPALVRLNDAARRNDARLHDKVFQVRSRRRRHDGRSVSKRPSTMAACPARAARAQVAPAGQTRSTTDRSPPGSSTSTTTVPAGS
jgi:hypothetical protein